MHSASKRMTCVGAAVASPKPRAMTLRWLALPLILLAMAPADAFAQLGGLGGAVPLGGIGGIGGSIGGIGGSVGLGNTIGVPGSNGIPDAPSNSIIGPKLNIPLGSLTQPSLPNTGSVTNTLNSTTSNALALPGQITNGLGNTVNQAVRGTQAATSPRRRSGVPPAGETRFVGGEVMLRLPSNLTEQALDALARRHGLTRLESQRVGLTGTTFHRWRIDSGREVPDVIRDLEAETGVSAAQPNYRFTLAQQPQARSMGADVSNSAIRARQASPASGAPIRDRRPRAGCGDRLRASISPIRKSLALSRRASMRSIRRSRRIRTAPPWRARSSRMPG